MGNAQLRNCLTGTSPGQHASPGQGGSGLRQPDARIVKLRALLTYKRCGIRAKCSELLLLQKFTCCENRERFSLGPQLAMAWHDACWGGSAPLTLGLAGLEEREVPTDLNACPPTCLSGVGLKRLCSSPLCSPRPWGASVCSARRKEVLKLHVKQSLCLLPICCASAGL